MTVDFNAKTARVVTVDPATPEAVVEALKAGGFPDASAARKESKIDD